jgi:hypothetical protein
MSGKDGVEARRLRLSALRSIGFPMVDRDEPWADQNDGRRLDGGMRRRVVRQRRSVNSLLMMARVFLPSSLISRAIER